MLGALWLVFFPSARTCSLDRRNRYALRSRARAEGKNPAPLSRPPVRNAGSASRAVPPAGALLANSKKASFFKQVYRVVGTIPPGRVLTYGQIATPSGCALPGPSSGLGHARLSPGTALAPGGGAGGRLLTRSPSPPGGALQQRHLLEQEGVLFAGHRVDMRFHQFVPGRGFLENRPESQGLPASPATPVDSSS